MGRTMQLTPVKMNILEIFANFQREKHYSPTMKELAELLGKSRTTVFEHCTALRKKGYLSASRGKVRSLKLTAKAEELLGDDAVEAVQSDNEGIPMLGSVAAGFPVEPLESDEKLSIPAQFSTKGTLFALKVSGESMIGDNIFPGDYVICRHTNEAKNGDIVVALVDENEATLKRFYKDKNCIRLEPSNDEYETLRVTNCLIKGVVTGLLRNIH
ncbi:LexA repressor [Sedimentisphaera cyanobacteriorum]|uniref:LexA repressor n=2 Tax=Sedimentisphaera cyanobacteriorum TaxID=1940790 RepID=A0A1Q2HQG2_9BACT|nr:LexA repressor [Sedimentisphaera cyanobacteriorum]